jgi:hypothetical protein
LAPGANGSCAARPSGVAPVLLPYTTLDVIVSRLSVGSASRYSWCLRMLACVCVCVSVCQRVGACMRQLT